MKELSTEKTMTVREVADALGVSVELITKRIRELFPRKMEKGKPTYLNESEVTALSIRIKENSSLITSYDRTMFGNNQLLSNNYIPQTSLEKKLIIKQAMDYMLEEINTLQTRIEEQKPAVEFYNAVTDSKDAIPMSQVAKVLDIGIGRNKLFEILREKGILQHNNESYQTFIDRGYFRVIEQKYEVKPGEVRISIKTLVYQKGIDYIRKVIKEG